MYKVYSNNYLLYDDRLESLKINNTKIELELNKTGSFSFTIYNDHPYYSFINKLKSIITVYQDDFLLFRGRCLDDEVGFHKEKNIFCEGELSFLLDSIQRPYDYSGNIAGFLSHLITEHNAQVDASNQFTFGTVTVEADIAATMTEYENTLDCINKRLLEVHGGYISIRHENNVSYIDYLADFNLLSPQKVEFSKNLLDMKRIRKGEDIATVVIPLGAKQKDADGNDTDERLTIKSVNNNLDYLYDQDAIDAYGKISRTVVYDEVEDASELLTKGQTYLAEVISTSNVVELSAADMATVDSDITSFHLGTYVNVVSNPHGIDENMLVSKLSIDLLNPASNQLVLGGKINSLTDSTLNMLEGQNQLITVLERINKETSEAIYLLEKNTSSSIIQAEESIMQIVTEIFYLKDEEDAIVSSISTELEQTKDDIEIRFNRFSASIEDIAAGTDAEFDLIRKYIRFVDGKIILGEIGNELELQISNNRISFVQDGAEVAYFSDRKLYVKDGEYTNSLRLGSFSFLPRSNGNLSFKKM